MRAEGACGVCKMRRGFCRLRGQANHLARVNEEARAKPSAAAASAVLRLEVGARVQARHRASSAALGNLNATKWYPGKILLANPDGTYNIQYDDKDLELGVLPKWVKPVSEEEAAESEVEVEVGDEEDEDDTVAQAQPSKVTRAQGYKLHLSSKSKTGYKGVHRSTNNPNRFEARGRGSKYLGSFDTLVDAAVAYAKQMKHSARAGRSKPAAPRPPSATPPAPLPASSQAAASGSGSKQPAGEVLAKWERRIGAKGDGSLIERVKALETLLGLTPSTVILPDRIRAIEATATSHGF